MKRILLFVVVLIWGITTFGQLSGTKYIPGDYATIATAVTALNTSGVGAGGVTFDVLPGYTENITTPILITATGSAVNPIVFQANSGPLMLNPLTNPLVTRTDAGTTTTTVVEAQGDAVIIIQGGDFITFDGIDIQATNAGIEYGFFLRRASPTDGCKTVTIKNSNITMNKGIVGSTGFVIGIYSSNLDANSLPGDATGITVTSTGGTTENLLITGNTIGNVHIGIAIKGYNHTVAPNNFMDQNNMIGAQNAGNIIQNFGGSATATAAGVHLYYQTSPNISYNTIDNVAGGGVDAIGGLYGIWHQVSANVGNFVANNNTITFGIGAMSFGVTFIQASPTGIPANSILIQNNTFSIGNFNTTGTTNLIYCSGATANNITVTGNSTAGSISNTSTGGSLYGYTHTTGTSTGGTQTVSNNNFSNISFSSSATIRVIDCRAASNNLQTINISNNIISDISSGGAIQGIYQSYGAAGSTVNNNIISGLLGLGLGTTGNNVIAGVMIGSNGASASLTAYNNTISNLRGTESVYGFWNQAGANTKIYQNNIYNLRNNATGIGPVYGMIINGGLKTTIYNNFISDLTAPYGNGLYPVMGIYIAAGTAGNIVNLYYNTIYLNASSSGTTFGTVGIYAQTNPILEMRNNIVVNKSNHAGNGGYTVAFRRFDPPLGTYSDASDNNDFYVSSNLNYGNYIFCDGNSTTAATIKDSTMAAYQERVAPRDAASFSEDPPFVTASSIPYDLHIKTYIPTHCESGAARVTTPTAVTNDFDQDIRFGETGYTGTGTAPDVGADEFNGIRTLLPITLTTQVTNAVCPVSNEGSINLTVSGGIPPYTYLWSNGATTEDLNGLIPGAYSVTVTDFTSVQASGSWTVGYNGTICNNSTVSGTATSTKCYNAYQTLTVSGLTVAAPNGHVELIAGQKIIILPGTIVQSGGYLWGHISTNYCTQPNVPMVATGTGDDGELLRLSTTWFSLYPNPTNGNFTIVQKRDVASENVQVAVYSMNGNKVMTGWMIGDKSKEFSASTLPVGIYFVKIIADDYVETIKLIKTR